MFRKRSKADVTLFFVLFLGDGNIRRRMSDVMAL